MIYYFIFLSIEGRRRASGIFGCLKEKMHVKAKGDLYTFDTFQGAIKGREFLLNVEVN